MPLTFDWKLTLDLGGFIGGVLGALAAYLAVVYSVKKTRKLDKDKERSRINALRNPIIIEARLSFVSAYYFGRSLEETPVDENITPFTWWRYQTSPTLYFDKPAVIAENLESINSLEEKEIKVILSTLGVMTEFFESLNEARRCTIEKEFPIKFLILVRKRGQLFGHLQQFFDVMAPKKQFEGSLVVDMLQHVPPLPDFWARVLSGPGIDVPPSGSSRRIPNDR